ncbi:hypothetical protein O9929_24640 [Vibrio lentus]|nr:hypothetical protein [Vibrio lentus]
MNTLDVCLLLMNTSVSTRRNADRSVPFQSVLDYVGEPPGFIFLPLALEMSILLVTAVVPKSLVSTLLWCSASPVVDIGTEFNGRNFKVGSVGP